jgi:hypothetical protein
MKLYRRLSLTKQHFKREKVYGTDSTNREQVKVAL